MKIALAQTNPIIGDVAGNTQRILDRLAAAAAAGAELAIFPEQAILGYPARDLLLRRTLIRENVDALHAIAAGCNRIGAIVGYAEPNETPFGRPAFNTAALLANGRIIGQSRKRLLPTYDVFDEARYFEPGGMQTPLEFRGVRLGVTVCEDLWSSEELLARPLYDADPVRDLVAAGARLVINVSASPYFLGKHALRLELIREHARSRSVPIVFVNQVGGNDELLFDGASCVVLPDGACAAQARMFAEDLLVFDAHTQSGRSENALPPMDELLAALRMGLGDYVRKCGFRTVVLGLSGGIDSALVAALAADALGPEHVHGVAMPSRYSSAHSLEDARILAENLGIRFSVIPIEPMHAAFERELAEAFRSRAADVTEENIQARCRGLVLMALSNKFGSLLLTTGNKSELGVGYCTLYGDMCGGLAVISDVPKTLVYRLARHVNETAGRDVIPRRTLEKTPSAELRPGQTDQDSLPPYDVLDEILIRHEEQLQSIDEIVAAGFERTLVEHVVRLVRISEYKRQQAAPGLKVTSRAFGFGRRMPIAARYRS